MLSALLSLLVAATLTRPPALLFTPPLESPDPRREGVVLLEITIDETGAVQDPKILESGGENFDQAALAAMLAFRFTPAEVDGAPAPVVIHYRLRFPRTRAEVRGLVRDQAGPLEAVKVRCGSRSSTAAVVVETSTGGRFRCQDLSPGQAVIDLEKEGFDPLSLQARLDAGSSYTLTATLARARPEPPKVVSVGPEVVVRAKRRRRAGELALANAEARGLPGIASDAIKSVELMPSVARTPAGSGALVVWGAASEETASFVDDLPIPWLFHLGGQRSVLPSALVESVALTPAAFGGDKGRAVGGVLSAETRALEPDQSRAELSADFLDAAANVEIPLRQGGVFIGARQGWLDRLASLVAPEAAAHALIPEYRDLCLSIGKRVDPETRLQALVVAADDAATVRGHSDDPSQSSADQRRRSFVFGMVGAKRQDPSGAESRLSGSFGWQRETRELLAAGTTSSVEEEVLRLGARAERRARVAQPLWITLGLDAAIENAQDARAGSLTLPPLEGDRFVLGAPPSDLVNQDRWRVTTLSLAPYAAAELRLGPLLLEPSLRVDFLGLDESRATPKIGATPEVGSARLNVRLEPRAAARLTLLEILRLTAAVGLYSQGPSPSSLSAVFGNPALGPVDALHATAGVEVDLPFSARLSLDAFFRRGNGLAARSPDPVPALAAALVGTGQARARGVQASLRFDDPSGLFGWLSYTLSKSERRASASVEWRRFDFDQTHQISLTAGWKLEEWTFSARARAASGFPRTPVTGHYSDLLRGVEVPLLGPAGSIELPLSFQLDAHLDRRFRWPELELTVALDLLNCTATKNPEEIVYNADFSAQSYVTGLGFLAVLGLKVVL
ncbi:MAG: TonB-dependent receptor [Myxococcota bacterium]